MDVASAGQIYSNESADTSGQVVGVSFSGTHAKNPSEHVIITTKSESRVHSIHDQAVIRSWSYRAGPTTSFTHPVVQQPRTRLFYAVQQQSYICSWAEKDESLVAMKKVQAREVHSLLTCKALPEAVIVVLKDGGLSTYGAALSQLGDIPRVAHNATVEYAFTFSSQPSGQEPVIYVVTVEKNNATGIQAIRIFTINEAADQIVARAKHDLSIPYDANILSCSFLEANKQFSYILSDGKWVVCSFAAKSGARWFASPPDVTAVRFLAMEGQQAGSVAATPAKKKPRTRKSAAATVSTSVPASVLEGMP